MARSHQVRASRITEPPLPSNDLVAPEHVLAARKSLDLLVAFVALVFLAPLMLFIALLIWAHDGGPAVFVQKRIGLNGRRFSCLKFRTMVMDAEDRLKALLESDAAARWEWAESQKLRRDPRVTWLGRFLRKSSLDELPQLLNVLRGDMSLVGPRPIVDSEVIRYGRWFRQYCSVRPGITGLWQVSGRNDIGYRRRVAMDVLYSRRHSAALDLAIMARTVPAVLLKTGY